MGSHQSLNAQQYDEGYSSIPYLIYSPDRPYNKDTSVKNEDGTKYYRALKTVPMRVKFGLDNENYWVQYGVKDT